GTTDASRDSKSKKRNKRPPRHSRSRRKNRSRSRHRRRSRSDSKNRRTVRRSGSKKGERRRGRRSSSTSSTYNKRGRSRSLSISRSRRGSRSRSDSRNGDRLARHRSRNSTGERVQPGIDEDSGELLPVLRLRDELLQLFRSNQARLYLVVVCTGETGSGKTTQIPQILLELEQERRRLDPKRRLRRLRVAVTQPRRVAAIAIAQRVAAERGGKVGGEVGYSVRFDDCTTPATEIKYMTDGVLLREFLASPDLDPFGYVVLDEAHVRSVHTDTAAGLLKAALAQRPELTAVVTSATLDVAKFSAYFGGCPTFNIPGRVHDVDIYHSRTRQVMTATGPAAGTRYVEDAIDVVRQIHNTQGPGHVLVFLTGRDEIERVCAVLRKGAGQGNGGEGGRGGEEGARPRLMKVLPLYGALPAEAQAAMFAPVPRGVRKVVVATNVAETSVTVPGVRFVVDAGYVKQ
ncbi:unnamed protein product, partial [Phaeothamnion confervicola]